MSRSVGIAYQHSTCSSNAEDSFNSRLISFSWLHADDGAWRFANDGIRMRPHTAKCLVNQASANHDQVRCMPQGLVANLAAHATDRNAQRRLDTARFSMLFNLVPRSFTQSFL